MWSQYLWHAALAICCGYAFVRGGAPERLTAIIMAAGSIASLFVLRSAYREMEVGLLTIDLADQIALTLVMLAADRFWLMALVGFHLLEPLIGLAKAITPSINPGIYARTENTIGYLLLLLIAVGTNRHRGRLLRYGADPSWTGFSGRLTRD